MKSLLRLLTAVAALSPVTAWAQTDDALPAVRMVRCEPACANSTTAKTNDNGMPSYPFGFLRDSVEAYIQLRYTVGTDGVVKDIVVLHQIGPDAFARAASDWQSARKYTPAILNGQPVEQSRVIQVNWTMNKVRQARGDVTHAYDLAAKSIKDGQFDEASAVLSEELNKEDLTFFERGMLDSLVAAIGLSKKDYLSARNAVELPTSVFKTDLPAETLKQMMRFRIIADLGLNNIDDAVLAADMYGRTKNFDPADPLLKLVEDARNKADALPQLIVSKRIPNFHEAGDNYSISRRTFSFTTVSGSLDKFALDCRQQSIESQISGTAEWHVPKDWDQCFLTVWGTPGAVYQINQFKD